MRLYICIIFSLSTFQLWSQNKVYTKIQTSTKKYPEKDFYFDRVLDRRANKENIGYIYKSSLTYKHPADFKNTLPQEFLSFLRNTFPNKTSQQRLLLAVNEFEIEHKITGKKLDSGIVRTNFDLYLLRNDSAFFIYNYTNELIDVSENITYSHPNRMKRSLLLALQSLDSALQIKPTIFAMDLRTISDSLRLASSLMSKGNFIENDSISQVNNYPSEHFLLLGVHSDFTTSNLLIGANVDLLFQLKKHPKVLIGATVNYLFYGYLAASSLPPNTEYTLKKIDFGLRILKQLKKDIFFNFQSLFFYGNETYKYQNYFIINQTLSQSQASTSTETIYGGEFDFGIYLIPAQKQNFYTGIDLFLRPSTSNVIENALGIKVNFGFKF